jgi:hypothetical protein
MFARFPRGGFDKHGNVPEWITFIREVNGVLPDTFGAPETLRDTPHVGYDTEKYPNARVIHGPGDEGVRIVADSPEVAGAFRAVAVKLDIHLANDTTEGS